MPINFNKRAQRWHYQFRRTINGQRQRASRLLPKGWTQAQANTYDQKETARLYALATGVTERQNLIDDAVLLYLQQHAPALKNFTDLQRSLANMLPWYTGQPMTALATIARQFSADQAGKLAPASIRNRIAYLRAACRWAWKHHGMGNHDPAERLVMPKVKNERHIYIDRAQLLRIARAIPNLNARAVVLIAFYSGMRLAEILRAKPTSGGWLLVDTKNGDRRIVPIHPAVAHLARRWPRPVAARTVQGQFSRAASALGHHDLRLHDLRHSAASAMINAKVDLYTVGGVLGHKSPISTKRYSHLATSTLAAAVGMIGKNLQTRPQAKAA